MNLKSFYTLCFLLMSFWAFAQTPTVSGFVYLGGTGLEEPVPGYPVSVTSAIGDVYEDVTDEEGFYSIEFETTDIPIVDFIAVVSTFDFCSGEPLQEFIVQPNDAMNFEVDFYVCVGDIIDPPAVCDAFFHYEQLTVEPYEVQFIDISYSNPPTTSWFWDFGDGTSSDEQNPVHEWAEVGEYEVTLTIENDSCSSTFTSLVIIDDEVVCGCPEYWDPVCVVNPSGDTITFSNICFAECEGYSLEDTVDCDWIDPCNCEDLWDPVCVVTDYGEFYMFPNACWAECEGFGPDSYVDCEDDCLCDDEWDPVCVITEDGNIITFPNLCYANCEGFGDDSIVDCEDDCECPADVWDPVCVINDWGETITFPNACYAECEGYGEDSFIDCEDDCICPDVWDPVCVATGGMIITFPNACYAECEGFGPDSFVDCEDECDCPTDEWDPVCVVNAWGEIITFSSPCFAACEGYGPDAYVDCEDDCDCPADVWDPVCVATPSGGFLTFQNACYAECEGYSPDIFVDCEDDCICPEYYDPVCVIGEDGDIITFDNICFAACEGYGPDSFVDCEDDCLCDDVWDPVCVETAWGIYTFPNACYAECEGFGPDSFVDCEDECDCPTDEWDPVCVVTAWGEIITFSSPCFAECEGYGPDSWVDCEDDCICPDVWDPVCVETADGEIITFGNACEAACEGYGEDSFVECEGECECYDLWDPVCVLTEDGIFLTFPNDCFAECEGYGPDSWVDCDWEEDCFADFHVNFDNPAGTIGLEVEFVDASFTSEGEIVAWAWNFGDGVTSNEQNPTHTYAEEGIYEVTLEIETSEGCVSVFVMHLCVGDGGYYEGPECQAMFFFDLANDSGTSFAFQDVSFGDIETWSWDFGDGNTSEEQNPVHDYENPGAYLVTLTVTSGDCESSVTMLVFSDPNVWYESECMSLFVPFIGGDPVTGSGENTVFFLNLSSPDAVSFEWDFGDGTTSDEFITIHEYAQGGTYEVTLTITTADGCSSSFTATIDLDTDDFTGAPDYSLTTSTEEADIFTEVKLFPNPATNKVNVEFNLTEAGSYNVRLMAIDGTTVLEKRADGQKGLNATALDINALPQGIYFINIQSGESTTSLRMIKE